MQAAIANLVASADDANSGPPSDRPRAYLLGGPMRKRQHENVDGAANLSWKASRNPVAVCLHDVGFFRVKPPVSRAAMTGARPKAKVHKTGQPPETSGRNTLATILDKIKSLSKRKQIAADKAAKTGLRP